MQNNFQTLWGSKGAYTTNSNHAGSQLCSEVRITKESNIVYTRTLNLLYTRPRPTWPTINCWWKWNQYLISVKICYTKTMDTLDAFQTTRTPKVKSAYLMSILRQSCTIPTAIFKKETSCAPFRLNKGKTEELSQYAIQKHQNMICSMRCWD